MRQTEKKPHMLCNFRNT